ncbi:MAG TPA: septum formation initiator family protein, partial [Actinomycetota bacterium]|nr:septum formation initiator family protein [Actinomycetota bacterium]
MVRTAAPPTAPPERPAPHRRQLLAIGLLVAAFLVFFPTKQLVAQKMRMHRLEARLVELQRNNEELEAEVRRMQDPQELEILARERLGLVKPGEDAYM